MTIAAHTKKHYGLFLVVIFFGLILGGASCKDLPTNTPADLASPTTTTPEQAWAMYVEGWKQGNLDKVLNACAPNREAQDRCREKFLGVQKAGNREKMADVLNRGKLTSGGKTTGEILYYTFSLDGQAAGASFQISPTLGWRLLDF